MPTAVTGRHRGAAPDHASSIGRTAPRVPAWSCGCVTVLRLCKHRAVDDSGANSLLAGAAEVVETYLAAVTRRAGLDDCDRALATLFVTQGTTNGAAALAALATAVLLVSAERPGAPSAGNLLGEVRTRLDGG